MKNIPSSIPVLAISITSVALSHFIGPWFFIVAFFLFMGITAAWLIRELIREVREK
jgi:hypothetical protein